MHSCHQLVFVNSSFFSIFLCQFGFKSVMSVKDTMVYVVMCLKIDNIKTKILAIKVIISLTDLRKLN